jgi:hypothetical protein
MFGIEHLTIDEISVFDHTIEIVLELQRTLIRTKNGSYFKTHDIHQVPNCFIELLLSRELKGYCKEEELVVNIGLPGIDDDNIHNQPYCTNTIIPCKRSKIYFCETYLLNIILANSKYWYIASRVKKNQSALGRDTTCIIGGANGCILFDYNWTQQILIIQGKCDVQYEFLGFEVLDRNNLQPYRTVNQDITTSQIFIERDGKLCKVVHVINAYVPTNGHFTITDRTMKSDIFYQGF